VAVRAGDADAPSGDLRFASAVAAFGMLLRDSEHKGNATFDTVRRLAVGTTEDASGYRAEFLGLVARAESLGAGRRAAVSR
jgi:Ca-activated chloride channel family protein